MSDRPKPPRPGSNPKILPPPLPRESFEPPSPELNSMLRAYLEEHEQDKAEGNTIANLRLEVHAQQIQINELGAKTHLHEMRLDRHGQAIRVLKTRVDALHDGGGPPPPLAGIEHDTGVHQVEELKRHLASKEAELKEQQKERRDSMTWWRRKKTDVALAVLGGVASMGVTALAGIIWYILTHGK